MPFAESVNTAFFMMIIVFVTLFGLYACIRLFSLALAKAENKPKQNKSV